LTVPGLLPSLQLRTFFWFGIVGVLGFLVDAGVLHLMLTAWDTNIYLARLCSFTCAATSTWIMNRIITFAAPQRRGRQLAGEWTAYLAASLGGGLVNYLVFALAVRLSPLLHQIPTIAVALGTLAGMSFNFLLYSRFVFRAVKPDSPA
jgi:putative flippase GtrA